MPVGTQSNEAAKLYDAALTQFVGWFDDDQHNGLGGTLMRMFKEDNSFGK